MKIVGVFLIATIAGVFLEPVLARADEPAAAGLKTERFDRDPGWEGFHNRIVPKTILLVKQDFGFRSSNFAGRAAGELGGRVQRSNAPAQYAAVLSPAQTLADKLTASGTFAVKKSTPGGGLFFGFFQSQQVGGSGRPLGSLGLNLDFESSGGRLAVRLITDTNKSCGTFITPYVPGKYRPTPIKNDGTRYRWTLAYDPQGADGNGQFTFTFHGPDAAVGPVDPSLSPVAREEALARFPHTTTFTVDVTPGLKKEGATFDRFGLINMMKSGGDAEIYFDDLQFNGQSQDFATDPRWSGSGNQLTYEDREVVGAHDFGYSPATNHAGGTTGELGGSLWRSGDYGYYADRVGPLNWEQPLEARGKVKLVAAGPDSDMFLGWFNSANKTQEPYQAGHFVGIHVGGPTRVGHYFLPVATSARGTRGRPDQGPILIPGRVFEWSLRYDPLANNGAGEIRVTLGSESVTLALKPGQRKEGAIFDRFGLFTNTAGGQLVRIYLDDLTYTASPSKALRD